MSTKSSLLSLSDAVAVLERAAETAVVCLGAEGFWRIGDQIQPSIEHIADLRREAAKCYDERLCGAHDPSRMARRPDGPLLVRPTFWRLSRAE